MGNKRPHERDIMESPAMQAAQERLHARIRADEKRRNANNLNAAVAQATEQAINDYPDVSANALRDAASEYKSNKKWTDPKVRKRIHDNLVARHGEDGAAAARIMGHELNPDLVGSAVRLGYDGDRGGIQFGNLIGAVLGGMAGLFMVQKAGVEGWMMVLGVALAAGVGMFAGNQGGKIAENLWRSKDEERERGRSREQSQSAGQSQTKLPDGFSAVPKAFPDPQPFPDPPPLHPSHLNPGGSLQIPRPVRGVPSLGGGTLQNPNGVILQRRMNSYQPFNVPIFPPNGFRSSQATPQKQSDTPALEQPVHVNIADSGLLGAPSTPSTNPLNDKDKNNGPIIS